MGNGHRPWPPPGPVCRLAVIVLAVLAGAAGIAGCSHGKVRAGASPKPARSTAASSAPPLAQQWPAYLGGPLHPSYADAETAITPAKVPDLVRIWHHAPHHVYLSSPVVADGAVYIGADSGWFYKLSATSGAVLAKVFLGRQPARTCPARGLVDTATIAPGPAGLATVYVGGPDGYLYALRASDLATEWRSLIAIPSTRTSNYFEWSSPTVADGKIYIGVSSHCDNPLIRGGVIGYDQATGRRFAEFFTVPKGRIGGSVWSSVAAADGAVYATTGNGPVALPELAYSESIIKLNPQTLKPLGRFQVPASQVTFDGDFGGSPVIFGRFVGACNKNGIFYALRRSTMKLAWRRRIGAESSPTGFSQCSAAPVYNGKHLYFGGPGITINGRAYRGSVQERSPATGKLRWVTGLPDGVIGSPAMDGGGVLAVGTYGTASTPNAIYLIDAATGKIIRTLAKGADFAQSAFSGNWLFTANSNGVSGWRG
jgi:outer membrane protein assembly factor BamB